VQNVVCYARKIFTKSKGFRGNPAKALQVVRLRSQPGRKYFSVPLFCSLKRIRNDTF
jgi:hypothetical protein